MKNLNSINNNNPTIHFIDPVKKVSFIKSLKIEKDFLSIKVSRRVLTLVMILHYSFWRESRSVIRKKV